MKNVMFVLIAAMALTSCSPHTTPARHNRYYKNKIEGPKFPSPETVMNKDCCYEVK